MKQRIQNERIRSRCTGEKRSLIDELDLVHCVFVHVVGKRYPL